MKRAAGNTCVNSVNVSAALPSPDGMIIRNVLPAMARGEIRPYRVKTGRQGQMTTICLATSKVCFDGSEGSVARDVREHNRPFKVTLGFRT